MIMLDYHFLLTRNENIQRSYGVSVTTYSECRRQDSGPCPPKHTPTLPSLKAFAANTQKLIFQENPRSQKSNL